MRRRRPTTAILLVIVPLLAVLTVPAAAAASCPPSDQTSDDPTDRCLDPRTVGDDAVDPDDTVAGAVASTLLEAILDDHELPKPLQGALGAAALDAGPAAVDPCADGGRTAQARADVDAGGPEAHGTVQRSHPSDHVDCRGVYLAKYRRQVEDRHLVFVVGFRCLVESRVEATVPTPVGTFRPAVETGPQYRHGGWAHGPHHGACVGLDPGLPVGQRLVAHSLVVHMGDRGPALQKAPSHGIRDDVRQEDGPAARERPARISESPVARPVFGVGPGLELVVLATASGLGLAAYGLVRLYRRLRREDILDNDLRSRMLEIVEARPGIQTSDIAGHLDVAVNTVLYHARIMDEYDLLVVDRGGGCVRLFPTGHDRRKRKLQAVVSSGPKRALVDVILEEPGIGLSEAARRLDRDRSTIKYHADRLVDEGILTDRRDGRSRRLVVAEDVQAILEAS